MSLIRKRNFVLNNEIDKLQKAKSEALDEIEYADLEIGKLKSKLINEKAESIVQYVVGFNAAIEQAKIVSLSDDFSFISPFKEVVNSKIVDVED